MKAINLTSVVTSYQNLKEDKRKALFNVWGVDPKPDELVSLDIFIKRIRSLYPNDPKQVSYNLGDCYFGFTIPRISKEMDCLWIGSKSIVNVELKSQSVSLAKIEKQLFQNRYYLRHLGKTIYSFTFDSSSGTCYSLGDDNSFTTVDFTEIARAIYNVHKEELFTGRIEELFPPEKYLVSPFNNTKEFLEECYFLTNQQQEIKEKVLEFVNNGKGGLFYAIYGGPGTGKSLLVYDIARTLMAEGKAVIIGHSGSLNQGHTILNNNGWHITPTKNITTISYTEVDGKPDFASSLNMVADVYSIDEAQRCYNLEIITNEVASLGRVCIIAMDANQVMREEEKKYENAAKVAALVGNNNSKLSDNIRTNKLVYNFTKALFDRSKTVQKGLGDYVEISYFKTQSEALIAQMVLKDKGYKVPIYTPKTVGREEYQDWFNDTGESAHSVIGQEFDKVACLITPNMRYDATGKLISIKPYYYSEERMVYQILSRARSKIHLIIFDNPEILDRCISLLS